MNYKHACELATLKHKQKKMNLIDLGYNEKLERIRQKEDIVNFEIARVIAEHKERYSIMSLEGEFNAEITGNLRFTAKNREDFPAVGDWVAVTIFEPDLAVIHKILPRYSVITRQAVGQTAETQVIASNVDYAFLVQAIDRDFNINRLERYLTICNSSRIKPVIVLTKIDLIDKDRITELIDRIKKRISNIPVFALSNKTLDGFERLAEIIEKGKTYCMLGSSGAGKSTLLNNLAGEELMGTDSISDRTGKGRHITSHRELIILKNGGILIDNPGMREVGIADLTDGLELTFELIMRLSQNCKFKDCTHTSESDCAVLRAVNAGEIEIGYYENYLKMEKEKAFFESTIAERRKKDRLFGKILKNYKKDMKKNMF